MNRLPWMRRAGAWLRRPDVRRAAAAVASAVVAELAKGRAASRSSPAPPSSKRRYEPRSARRLSDRALERLLGFEGFSATWYKNGPADRWTIGFGTTEGVVPGLTREAVPGPISRDDARHYVEQVLVDEVEPAVARAVTVPLAPGQFDALVLFAYNLGGGTLRRSTLLKKLNAGDYDGAAAEFDRWIYSGKTVLRGLVARRAAERRMFEGKAG